jgi:hypothetical protein
MKLNLIVIPDHHNIADGGIKQTSINVYQLSYILKKNWRFQRGNRIRKLKRNRQYND